MLAQPGQQPRLDQRRLAAARGPVDQPDPEGRVGVGLLDPGLPEPEALGQAVPVPRAGQQFEEEVGVVLVEGPQPLRDDLDRPPVGVGLSGGGRERRGFQGRAGRRPTVPGAARRRDRCRLRSGGSAAGLRPCPWRAVPLRRPLRQRLQADPFQFLGDRVVDLPGRTGLGGGDLLQDLRVRVAPERPPPGQQLVEDHAQAEDVRAAIDPVPLAPGLLGAHVGGVPASPAPLPKSSSLSASPKSATTRLARGVDQDVGGLDVPVDQAPGVGVVQRLGDRRHQFRRLPEGQAGPASSCPPGRCPRRTWRRRSRGRRRCGPRRRPARCGGGRAWRGCGLRSGTPRHPRGRRSAQGSAP